MRILVTGATGTVGRHIVGQLQAAGHDVRALSRNPAAAALPTGVEVVAGDLSVPETVRHALDGVSAMHLITFGSDGGELTTGPQLMELAKQAGVRRVTVLKGSYENGHVEDAVEASGLEWAKLGPVEFMANMLEWAESIRAEGLVRNVLGDGAGPSVHEADIAAVAVTALVEPGHAGQTYWLTGPELLTAADKVRTISDAIGRELNLVELTDAEAQEYWRAAGHTAEEIEFFMWLRTSPPDVGRSVLPTVEEVTGRPARTFAQWVAENVDAFR